MLLIWGPHFETHCLGTEFLKLSTMDILCHITPRCVGLACAFVGCLTASLASTTKMPVPNMSPDIAKSPRRGKSPWIENHWLPYVFLEKKSPAISNLGDNGSLESLTIQLGHSVKTFCLIPLFLVLPFINTNTLSIFNCKSLQR